MVMADEVAKWFLGMWRFFSRRWIHNLAERVKGLLRRWKSISASQ